MGAVQKLATTVIVGLVGLATLLVVYLANEPNRRDDEEDEQVAVAIERGVHTYIANCVACHGPGGEGITTPGEAGTGRIGLALGGNTPGGQVAQALNQSQDPSERRERADVIRDALNYGRGQEPYAMPAWGTEGQNRLNQEQIEELVLMIQNVDWDYVYNETVHEIGGYPTPQPAPVAAAAAGGQAAAGMERTGSAITGEPGTPVASPVGAEPPAEQGASAAPAVTLTAAGILWDQTALTVPTGGVIALVNNDPIAHNFAVEGQNISVDMPVGAPAQATIDLPPGEYVFFCDVQGHEAIMRGTLTVT